MTAPITRSVRPEKPPVARVPVSAPTQPVKAEAIKPAPEPSVEVKAEKIAPVAATKPEIQKTYSDQEILAAVKPEFRKPAELKPHAKSNKPWERREPVEAKPAFIRPTKKARPPAGEYTRLHMNLGEEMGVTPIDIVNTIAGETGLPGKVVGKVDVRERHLFVDVAAEHANAILAKLNRASVKGNKVTVKAA